MPCLSYDPLSYGSLSSRFSDLKVLSGSGSSLVLSGIDVDENQGQDKVALKRLPLKAKTDCRVTLRELQIIKRLSHDNIVRTFKVSNPDGVDVDELCNGKFEDLDYVYLVQELLDADLHNVLERNGKLPEQIAKLLLYQVLRALKYTHSANVIHRDVKPANLFLNLDDLSLKVGDFGSARVLDSQYNHARHLTELITTRYYRSPEVILNPGCYGSAVDIWSTGCVFAEMLTGEILFPGQNDFEQINVIQSILHREGKFPTGRFGEVSQAGLDLLQKMLKLNPSKRPSAADLLEDPYFGDISDPKDELECSSPFCIEHEVDDLPVGILKGKILKECSYKLEKQIETDNEVNLFEDFDANFCIDIHEWSYCKESTEINSSNSCQEDNEQCILGNVLDNSTSSENICPSITNLMNDTICDEPYRDPACSEARCSEHFSIHMDIAEDNNNYSVSSEHSSILYPRSSPLLDFEPYCGKSNTQSTESELESCQNILQYSKSKNDLSKNDLCMIELNREIINRLNGLNTKNSCAFSEAVAFKKFNNLCCSIHWDQIRLWI